MKLFTKGAVLAGGKVEVKVVAVGFVGFRTEYRSEHPAGALVHAAEELPFIGSNLATAYASAADLPRPLRPTHTQCYQRP